jgi:hypothetical protein
MKRLIKGYGREKKLETASLNNYNPIGRVRFRQAQSFLIPAASKLLLGPTRAPIQRLPAPGWGGVLTAVTSG